MLSKNKIKYIRSLKLSKFRQMYNNFVVEGEKIALEILSVSNIEIESIICTVEFLEKHEKSLSPFQSKILVAKTKEMEQITFLKTATDIMLILKQLPTEALPTTVIEGLSLYLDDIQNPGNFGTIMRIADWFGIATVFCSERSAELYNPKVIQSSMGAFLRVRVVRTNFERIKKEYPKLPVYGTVLEGDNIFKMQLQENGIIVIGSEGKGITEATLPYITHPLSIPPHKDGGAESLNAAVATGIVCALFRNKTPP